MSRPDRSISYLKEHGYCVIRLPRSDVQPLQTLVRSTKKDLQRSGELSDIMISGANRLPEISENNYAPLAISGKKSSTIKLGVGLDILANVIAALGGFPVALNTGYSQAESLVFQFEDVIEDHVDINQLDQFLTTATIRPDQTGLHKALVDDKVYVINSIIKTTRLTVQARAERESDVGLNVPAVEEAISAQLQIDVSKATEGVVSYQGNVPVVFGFQALRLIYDDETGCYSAFNIVTAGDVAAKETGLVKPNFLTLDESVFFRLDEPGRPT